MPVLTDEPGVNVVVRSGRKVVAEGPTPCEANGISEGSYRIQVRDPRFEESETTVTLDPGAMEDVAVVTTPLQQGIGATLARKKGTLALVAILVLLLAGAGVVQPWGRTLALADLEARAADGSVTEVRLTSESLQGHLTIAGIPAPFSVPVSEDDAPGVVKGLRGTGLEVNTAWEVARLVRLAQEAQA